MVCFKVYCLCVSCKRLKEDGITLLYTMENSSATYSIFAFLISVIKNYQQKGHL